MRKTRATAGKPLQVPFEESLVHHFPAVALEFDLERNGPMDLSSLAKFSRYALWWLCPEGHSYKAIVYNRTYGKSGCPYCSGK